MMKSSTIRICGAELVAIIHPTERFPWDDLRIIFTERSGMTP